MAEHCVLVPLDGSPLSERALPYAAALARATESAVRLVTVWEEGERALIAQVPEVSESIFKKGEEHWERYLRSHAMALQADGVDVETEVLIGDPATEIFNLIDQGGYCYLVVASHGRSGLSRWRYGSVASSLVREARVTTLVVGPAVLEDEQLEASVSRVLVPLDGSPLAEAAIAEGMGLAAKFQADVVLARVLQWSTQAAIYGVPDVNIAAVDQDLIEVAETYMAKLAEPYQGAAKIDAVVLHGPPAESLITLVDERSIDLVVMTSHARGGLARVVLGSVADRLLQSKAPVLLVRPGLVD